MLGPSTENNCIAYWTYPGWPIFIYHINPFQCTLERAGITDAGSSYSGLDNVYDHTRWGQEVKGYLFIEELTGCTVPSKILCFYLFATQTKFMTFLSLFAFFLGKRGKLIHFDLMNFQNFDFYIFPCFAPSFSKKEQTF